MKRWISARTASLLGKAVCAALLAQTPAAQAQTFGMIENQPLSETWLNAGF